MIDWSASMQQTYEFYEVDPSSWKDKKLITTVKTGTITRDSEVETLGSATFDITDLVGECYIRVYLVSTQGDITDRRPLGTFLAQTPSSTFDGRTRNVSMDAYTPLIELKEKHPPIGYFVAKDKDVMKEAYDLTNGNLRAPVVKPIIPSIKLTNDFVADPNDTWLAFIQDLITAAHTSTCYEVDKEDGKYIRTIRTADAIDGEKVTEIVGAKEVDVTTETGEIVYSGTTSRESVYYCVDNSGETPKYYLVKDQNGVYSRSNEMTSVPVGDLAEGNLTTDTGENVYFGYTNIRTGFYCVVENNTRYKLALDEIGRVYYAPDQEAASMQPIWTYTDDNSSILYPDIGMDHDLYGIPNVVEVAYSDGDKTFYSTAENNDPNSPISTVSRGRKIVHRVTNPDIYGTVTQERLNAYAEELLKTLSTLEYTLTYVHGYCPVKVGDCVRINYERAGITNVKAKVIRQSIRLEPGCPVTETAIFTTKLWG